MKRLLRRIKLADQHHMGSGEVPNGFRICDNPDCLIIVSYEDGSLRFPFRMPHRSSSPPAFLHAIRAARLRVLGRTTLITDPTGPRCVLLLRPDGTERRETANKQQKKNNSAPDHLFFLQPLQSASTVALGGKLNQVDEVATSVLKQYGSDWPHALWFTTEADTKRLQTPVLRVDVVRYERSCWNASGKQGLLIRLSRRETHRLLH